MTNDDKKLECMNILKDLSGAKSLKFTDGGNSAIFTALTIAKRNGACVLLIPKDGGWLTYKTYPDMVGLEIIEVETDNGIIDLSDLKSKLEEISADGKKAALIAPTVPAYAFFNPWKEIHSVCETSGCFLIADACGGIGYKLIDPSYDYLCNCSYCDLLVSSFGKDKPINNFYGGMIATNNKKHFDNNKEVFSLFNIHDAMYETLIKHLNILKERLEFLLSKSENVKKDISNLGLSENIVHSTMNGINIIVLFNDLKEKETIINYCDKENLSYTNCPRYIRIEKDAISIEVKRLIK